MAEKEYHDPVIGKCRYKFFYVTNELYGGYSSSCEGGSESTDYMDSSEVVDLAERARMPVSLAGPIWREVEKKGFGEEVSPSQARELIKKLREARR